MGSPRALSRPPPSSPGHETYSLRVSYSHLGRAKLLTHPRRNAPHIFHACPHIPHMHTQHILIPNMHTVGTPHTHSPIRMERKLYHWLDSCPKGSGFSPFPPDAARMTLRPGRVVERPSCSGDAHGQQRFEDTGWGLPRQGCKGGGQGNVSAVLKSGRGGLPGSGIAAGAWDPWPATSRQQNLSTPPSPHL